MAGSVGERRPSRRTEESDVSITPGREMERKEGGRAGRGYEIGDREGRARGEGKEKGKDKIQSE